MRAEQKSSKGSAYGMQRYFAAAISAFAMIAIAAILCVGAPAQAFADDFLDADFYAVLKPDGTLVFQLEPSPIKSDYTYSGSLEGYASASKVPWLEKSEQVVSATFKEDFRNLQPTSLAFWFTGCANMQSIDLTNLDASKSTTMEKMFMGCASLTEIEGLEQFDTSSSTYFGGMFRDCTSLTSLDIAHFNASKVEVLCFMFNGCSSLETIDMSGEGWKTSSLHLMVHVWEGCSSLRSLDLSQLDTSNVTSMTCDFRDCTSLEYLNLSSFMTLNANIRNLFDGCTGLSTVVLGEGFTFNGTSDTRQCSLPEGNWKSSADGLTYTSDAIPNNVAATYEKLAAPNPPDSESDDVDDGSQADKSETQKGLKKGATAKVAGATYKVTNNAKATVAFQKAPKSKKSVTIPAAVTLNGKKYAVTSLAKAAFKGAKAKTIVVKTKKLTKKSVVGCFKGAKQLKTVKVPKAKRKAYALIFKKANSGCKVSVV